MHFSVNWFATLHQQGTVFNAKMTVEISGTMAATLVLAVVAFTLLYAFLVVRRLELLRLEEGLEEILERLFRCAVGNVFAQHLF